MRQAKLMCLTMLSAGRSIDWNGAMGLPVTGKARSADALVDAEEDDDVRPALHALRCSLKCGAVLLHDPSADVLHVWASRMRRRTKAAMRAQAKMRLASNMRCNIPSKQ